MNAQEFINDLPLQMAINAFSGTSFSPEKRGASHRNDYAATLEADYADLLKHAEKGGTLDLLEAEFSRFRAGYGSRYRAWLSSHSRCLSTMITGPSNFPTARNNKRNDIEHRRFGELRDFHGYGKRAAIRNLRPDLRPIMAGDADAIERLEAELHTLESRQARMKAINNAHKAYTKKPESLLDADLSEQEKAGIRAYVPGYSWEPHPNPPYRLTNNSANVRRVTKRIEQLKRMKALPTKEFQGDGVRVEDCPTDNRVRLFFDGKPDEAIRSNLKKHGFRWSPTIGAWQAYRNSNSMPVAQSFVTQKAAQS